MHSITRQFSFSAGHRIPHHNGKCSHPHGHTYTLIITLSGPLNPVDGRSDGGMVADFSDIKRVVGGWIDEHLDHAMIIWKDDEQLLKAYEGTAWRHYIMDQLPTAEGIAEHTYNVFTQLLQDDGQTCRITDITVQETESCHARFTP